MRPVSFVLLVLSVLLFAVSVALPVIHYDVVSHRGTFFLVVGWIGPIGLHFGWYANPLMLLSAGLYVSHSKGAAKGRLAAMCVASVLAISSYFSLRYGSMIGRNESEGARFLGYAPGIFVWSGAVLLSLASAIVGLLATRTQQRLEPGDAFDEGLQRARSARRADRGVRGASRAAEATAGRPVREAVEIAF